MRLSKTRFWMLIIFSFILGIIAQTIYISDASRNPGFFNTYLGFTLLIPLFVFLFIIFLNISKLENKFVIIFLSVILFEVVLFLNLIFYPDVLLLILGFIPALIVGLIYGSYIAYNLDKNTKIESPVKYAIYGALIGIIILNILGIFHYIYLLRGIPDILFGTRGIYYIGSGAVSPVERILTNQLIGGASFWIFGAIIGWIVGKIKERKK